MFGPSQASNKDKKVKLFAQKLPEIPDSTMRAIGFFLMMMGLLVIYLGGGKNG